VGKCGPVDRVARGRMPGRNGRKFSDDHPRVIGPRRQASRSRYAPAMNTRMRGRGGLSVAASAWVPPIAMAALIFVLSAQPDLRFVPDAGLDFVVRKVGHMGIFGILALLLLRAAAISGWPRPWAWAIVLTILYAITDELHQGVVGGRTQAAADVGFDAAGALIAIVAGHTLRSRRRHTDPTNRG